jgi:hypothetical protein
MKQKGNSALHREPCKAARAKNQRWTSHFGFALLIFFIGGPAASAMSTMGSPSAGLRQAQFRVGADYSYNKMDLKFSDGKYVEYLDGFYDISGPQSNLKLKDVKVNTVYANLGYGVTDYFEVFLRLGGTNATFGGTTFWESGEDFDSDTDFAIGGGVKATFYENGRLKIGGLFQADWSEWDGAIRPKDWPVADDTVTFDVTQLQIAAGPSYQLTDMVSIYGGPFLHFVYGDWQDIYSYVDGGLITAKNTWTVEEDACFGGYIGTQIDLAENSIFLLEYQHTSAADAFGASVAVKF